MATLTSSSSTAQSYFMRFSSHSASLSRSLLGLLSESYCTDVHISTGHQSQTIRAHKIILSAFSPYFKSLFSSLPSNQFPVIIIREIQYDILRTIIEFCYRGEILVPRDKLEDIISAAKFLQIEGAKDFVTPKHQSSQQSQHQNNSGSAVLNANNRMQINLQQNNINQNYKQQQSLIALQQQQQKQMSILSKLIQKPPALRGPATVSSATNATSTTGPTDHSMPIISGVRHINEKELNEDQRVIKQELIDEEVLDEEEEELEECLDELISGGVGDESQKSGEKSGMFSEFEDQSLNNKNNNNNNESNRQSEDSCAADDEPMDTGAQMGHILAKVPADTSVSIGGDPSGGQQKNDISNVPTHGSEEDLLEEEEEEYEDEFDEEEEECDSTNPLDLLNVNLSETDESHNPLTGTDMSSAAARAIAASTLASFGTNLDLDSEASQSSQYGGSPSLTINTVGGSERRGRGRPPKYEMGTVFSGQSSTASTSSASGTPIVIAAQTGQSPQHQQSITITPSSQMAGTSSSQSSSATRSRRGRPPSMPEELLRSLTGRLDKAHHKCPHCPQIYYGYHAMRDHITSVHLNSGEKYICNLCNKEYTWRITLRKHLKFHHGVHPDQVGNA